MPFLIHNVDPNNKPTHLCNKGLTYSDICDLAETQYQEAKGVGKWPHATHAKDSTALPSSFTCTEVNALTQCFQNGLSISCLQDKSNDTYNLCSEKGHWANKCPNRAYFMNKHHSNTTKPNPALQDSCNDLDMEIQMATVDTAKKDEKDNKQTSRVGNLFHPLAQSPPQLSMDIPSTGPPSVVPQWFTNHLMAMHTDSPMTSNQDTNVQLLDFNTTTWVIKVPIQDTNLALPATHIQARAQLPQLVFRNWPNSCHPPPSNVSNAPFNAAESPLFWCSERHPHSVSFTHPNLQGLCESLQSTLCHNQ